MLENEEFITNVEFVRESFEEKMSRMEWIELKEMEIGPNEDEEM